MKGRLLISCTPHLKCCGSANPSDINRTEGGCGPEARVIAGAQKRNHILIEDKGIDGINMVSHHLQLPQRHTSRVTMYIVSRHGVPYESASKDKRAAQPYRLQKANKSDGQWSRWASDIRQSQPDQWSSSSRWHSSAGDDSSGGRYLIRKDHNVRSS